MSGSNHEIAAQGFSRRGYLGIRWEVIKAPDFAGRTAYYPRVERYNGGWDRVGRVYRALAPARRVAQSAAETEDRAAARY
jgi:hypothetical protein